MFIGSWPDFHLLWHNAFACLHPLGFFLVVVLNCTLSFLMILKSYWYTMGMSSLSNVSSLGLHTAFFPLGGDFLMSKVLILVIWSKLPIFSFWGKTICVFDTCNELIFISWLVTLEIIIHLELIYVWSEVGAKFHFLLYKEIFYLL